MPKLPVRAGSLILAAIGVVGGPFASGRAGIGERPVLVSGGTVVAGRPVAPQLEPSDLEGSPGAPTQAGTSLNLAAYPELGRIGLEQPCPTGIDAALGGPEAAAVTTCAVHLDLAGAFATTRAPGRFELWCQQEGLVFRPDTVLSRDVRIVGSATAGYRTVLVLEVAPEHAGELPTFATLRRDPSQTGGSGPGCPTLQQLGTGLPVDREITDPFVPTPDGVPILLSEGGVAVRPSVAGVELLRLTPQVPAQAP